MTASNKRGIRDLHDAKPITGLAGQSRIAENLHQSNASAALRGGAASFRSHGHKKSLY